MSAIRAYVNGESQYSKGQKDATAYLKSFILYSDPAFYNAFERELSVPIGDRIARVGMQKNMPYDKIREGLLKGRNHPDDIANLVWLFQKFHNFPFFREAIVQWELADRYIAELHRIGQFAKSNKLEGEEKDAVLADLAKINEKITYHQKRFSNILSEASRIITRLLYYVNIIFVLLVVAIGGVFVYRIINRLLEFQDEIERQNFAKEEFISIAAHELKTPITSIKASLQILDRYSKQNLDTNKIAPFVFKSNKQINRLTGLVNELLDVTKIQQGKLTMRKRPVELDALVADAVQEVSPLFEQKFIIIKDLPAVTVEADPARIIQVVINLLTNAAKYSPQAREVHIWVEETDEEVSVFVRDFGMGIPKEKIPFLFNRFYRVYETKELVQGLGLGLYICREIIRSHDGNLDAISDTGKGSTFWFSLPT